MFPCRISIVSNLTDSSLEVAGDMCLSGKKPYGKTPTLKGFVEKALGTVAALRGVELKIYRKVYRDTETTSQQTTGLLGLKFTSAKR